MVEDIIVNKAATIERCIQRIKEDYDKEFRTNFTKQDAVILNIERACQACIDIAAHIVKSQKLGIPQDSRDTFDLLHDNGIIPAELKNTLKSMVGFRNIAIHDYASLNLNIVEAIVESEIRELLLFSKLMIQNLPNQ